MYLVLTDLRVLCCVVVQMRRIGVRWIGAVRASHRVPSMPLRAVPKVTTTLHLRFVHVCVCALCMCACVRAACVACVCMYVCVHQKCIGSLFVWDVSSGALVKQLGSGNVP